jgi:hypothetical protein
MTKDLNQERLIPGLETAIFGLGHCQQEMPCIGYLRSWPELHLFSTTFSNCPNMPKLDHKHIGYGRILDLWMQ